MASSLSQVGKCTDIRCFVHVSIWSDGEVSSLILYLFIQLQNCFTSLQALKCIREYNQVLHV